MLLDDIHYAPRHTGDTTGTGSPWPWHINI